MSIGFHDVLRSILLEFLLIFRSVKSGEEVLAILKIIQTISFGDEGGVPLAIRVEAEFASVLHEVVNQLILL